MKNESRKEVRRTILQIQKPFHITDLISYLNKKDIKDNELILQVLDELYSEDMIKYCDINKLNTEDSWMFRVA